MSFTTGAGCNCSNVGASKVDTSARKEGKVGFDIAFEFPYGSIVGVLFSCTLESGTVNADVVVGFLYGSILGMLFSCAFKPGTRGSGLAVGFRYESGLDTVSRIRKCEFSILGSHSW